MSGTGAESGATGRTEGYGATAPPPPPRGGAGGGAGVLVVRDQTLDPRGRPGPGAESGATTGEGKGAIGQRGGPGGPKAANKTAQWPVWNRGNGQGNYARYAGTGRGCPGMPGGARRVPRGGGGVAVLGLPHGVTGGRGWPGAGLHIGAVGKDPGDGRAEPLACVLQAPLLLFQLPQREGQLGGRGTGRGPGVG